MNIIGELNMRKSKLTFIAVSIFICLLLLGPAYSVQDGDAGKSETDSQGVTTVQSDQIPQTVKFALKFAKGQSENYRLQTLAQRKVSVNGSLPENTDSFQGGQTTDKIDMVFNQQVQSVDAAGNAIEKITIKQLKYYAEIRNKAELDFDSTKDKEPNNALFALIGKSYTIEMTPSGKVSKIIDINALRAAIKDKPSYSAVAGRLVSDKTIEKNHSIPLPDANDSMLSNGGKWSNITSFDFGLMGVKSYQKTYTLKKIEKNGQVITAIADMNGIPSVAGTKEEYEEGAGPVNLPMSDVRLTYAGQMVFDASEGVLTKYDEDLKNEWLMVLPVTGETGTPLSLSMTAIQSYKIEKIK